MSVFLRRVRIPSRFRIRFSSVFLIILVLAAGCGGDSEVGQGQALPKLHAEGRDIVDGEGNVVILRGVNLGAWLFHENWISAVDYPLHGRIHLLGGESGIGGEVDEVLREVGPGGDDDWLVAFRTGLAGLVGDSTADALLAEAALYPEIYDDSDLPLRLRLEERFGTDGRDRLLDTFQGAWIREADIAWVADQGFNVVRVPIGYRNLVTASDTIPLVALDWNERAFGRIDDLLRWCEKHGIYAVLDIQEAPGGANDYSGPPTLYDDPAMQALTVELWEEISRRYGDRNVVAAYSLLAEPFGAPSPATRDDMYDLLVRAVRDRGDDHLLIIHDGFFGLWTLPRDPASRGWEGVVYSTHLFEFGIRSLGGYRFLLRFYDLLFNWAQGRQEVPYYIGSFSGMADEDYAYGGVGLMVDLYERSEWSWSLWTYKKVDDPIDTELFGTTTSWGLRGRLASAFDRPDVHRDDEDALARKLGGYADVVLDPNVRLLEILTGPMTKP